MSSKIIKECVFLVIFILVVVLIIGFIFYEFIPSQVVPEAEKYEQASDTTKLLTQIQDEKQAEEEENSNEEVLKSYQISSEDLTYSNDTQYVKGKNHPFFDYTSVTSDDENSVSTSSNTTDSNSTDSNTTTDSNTIPDDSSTNSTEREPSDLATNTTSSNTTNDNTNKVDTSTLRDTADSNKSSK